MNKELEKLINDLDDNAKLILKHAMGIMLSRIKYLENYFIEIYDKLKMKGDKMYKQGEKMKNEDAYQKGFKDGFCQAFNYVIENARFHQSTYESLYNTAFKE